jgi:hypothetical protein
MMTGKRHDLSALTWLVRTTDAPALVDAGRVEA